jgi:U6 snRNA-associated Sm-like protein LSm6
VDYRGVLACLDGYMNIALEQTEEYVNGQVLALSFIILILRIIIIIIFLLQLKNKYGDAFIRGNNVLYISTVRRR